MSCKKQTKLIYRVIAMILVMTLALPGFAFAEETNTEVQLIKDDVKYCVDNNRDGKIDAEDALNILKFAVKLIGGPEPIIVGTVDYEVPANSNIKVGDVDCNNIIDATDALLVLKYAAKLIDRFPVEDEIDVTLEPTEDVTPEPTEDVTPEPTEDVTPEPTEDVTPEPTEDITPAPTESDGPVIIENAFAINVKDAGAVADVDGTKVTFKEADESGNGVLLENMFIGKDTSNGAAISFFVTSPIDIKPMTYGYTSIISLVNAEHTQILKYDLEGTRQLATIPTPKLNHWGAELNIKQGSEYFITYVANSDGLHVYINGTNIGRGEYGQIDENKGRSDAMAIFSKSGSKLYLGGTVNVPADFKDMCRHKVAAGTVVRDIVGYVGEVTDDDVKAWYDAYTSGNVVIPTPNPAETPAPTEDVTPEPTEEPTPEPTVEVPVETVVSMEVKETNGAATVENGVITFVETTSTNGVVMSNPFANKELNGGGSISFWYTPSEATKAAGLITLVNYTDLLQFARFNDDGTLQFRDAYSTQIYNVWSVDTKFEAGTSYFMTAVMSDVGLKYYANGEPIVITETKGNPGLKNELQINDAIVPLITNPNTVFYFGGTTNIWEKMVASTGHALPAGLEIKDVKAHMSALSADEVKSLYDAAMETPVETPEPTEDPTPEPTVEPTPEPTNEPTEDSLGVVVKSLEVKETTYTSIWGFDNDLQVGDLMFGDRDKVFRAVDESFIGSEFILTPCDAKKLSGELAVVTAAKDMVLSVGFDKRLANIPEWVADFTKVDAVCEGNNDVIFIMYQKEVKAGESITLYAQEQASGVQGYIVIATAK